MYHTAVGCHLYLARYRRLSERPSPLIKRENEVTDVFNCNVTTAILFDIAAVYNGPRYASP